MDKKTKSPLSVPRAQPSASVSTVRICRPHESIAEESRSSSRPVSQQPAAAAKCDPDSAQQKTRAMSVKAVPLTQKAACSLASTGGISSPKPAAQRALSLLPDHKQKAEAHKPGLHILCSGAARSAFPQVSWLACSSVVCGPSVLM